MLQPMQPLPDEQAVLVRASGIGFSLLQYETDAGQLVWEWRRGDEPRPQFLRRRVAIEWMDDWLAREFSRSTEAQTTAVSPSWSPARSDFRTSS